MTALTQNDPNFTMKDGVLHTEDINTATTANEIFKGAMVNRGATHRGVEPAANTENELFAGVAAEYAKGDAGTAAIGDEEVNVYRQGIFRFKTAGGAGDNDPDAVAATDVGAEVYVVDDNTVGKSGGTGATCYVKCGRLVKYVSASEVYVDITGYTK